jgi:hypothetical protein
VLSYLQTLPVAPPGKPAPIKNAAPVKKKLGVAAKSKIAEVIPEVIGEEDNGEFDRLPCIARELISTLLAALDAPFTPPSPSEHPEAASTPLSPSKQSTKGDLPTPRLWPYRHVCFQMRPSNFDSRTTLAQDT